MKQNIVKYKMMRNEETGEIYISVRDAAHAIRRFEGLENIKNCDVKTILKEIASAFEELQYGNPSTPL